MEIEQSSFSIPWNKPLDDFRSYLCITVHSHLFQDPVTVQEVSRQKTAPIDTRDQKCDMTYITLH